MNKWISVKDRLPEHEKIVLACKKGYIPKVLLFHEGTNYLFLSVDNMRFQYRGITHWMPLPEVPQDDII